MTDPSTLHAAPQRREPEPRLDSHDDDPELVLYIPFTRVVKLKSINIIGGHAGEGTAPAKIKLCVGREWMPWMAAMVWID